MSVAARVVLLVWCWCHRGSDGFLFVTGRAPNDGYFRANIGVINVDRGEGEHLAEVVAKAAGGSDTHESAVSFHSVRPHVAA